MSVLAQLQELALDLRWTWSHEADDLWARIDPDAWEERHNPWSLLSGLQPARLEALASDTAFTQQLDMLVAQRRAYAEANTWFQTSLGTSAPRGIAYFSMEFGLGSALPLYAGGLGVLAGDFLKAASDLGAPLTGVGLLYQEGYFRQRLDPQGGQRELYPFNNPADMPIEPVLVDGTPLRLPLQLPGRDLQLRVWRAAVGRNALYLLDSNDPSNSASDRGVTARLYDDDPEVRFLQECVLGVGGWRMVEALGLPVDVCHINEGHAAFAVVERASALARRSGLTFQEALWATRAANVFTTHTPVVTGFDQFEPELVERHLPVFAGDARLGPSRQELFALGRIRADDEGEPFNMAFAAVRGSAACLAVSRIHEGVSRDILHALFPRWPRAEAPISHVTNGVHTPTWDSAEADRLWTSACGKDRWRGPADNVPQQAASMGDEAIWAMRGASRADFVGHVRRRLASQLRMRGLDPAAVAEAQDALDPNVLTLGFARRFTAYKRPNLLLHDPDRLARILLDERRPVQIVLAGKAHPADPRGKAMIRDWVAFTGRDSLRRRVVFLEDYDLGLAQELVQGVDVWLNTPRRPWEACGTSGMKVLVNGGLNCSVLDGWWAEAYQPGLGWAIEDAPGLSNADADRVQAEAVYRLLENEIAPEFYSRDPAGLPRAWIARIRRSMAELTLKFGSARMLGDYMAQVYAPAVAALHERAADDWRGAKDLAAWSERVRRHWREVQLGAPTWTRDGGAWRVSTPVYLGEISPEDVRVELYADDPDGGFTTRPMAPVSAVPGATNGYVYAGEASADRPAEEFTVRAVPARDGAGIPAELALIAWQK